MPPYKNPPIFGDMLSLYKQYFAAHKNLPKLFRSTVGAEMMREMTTGMKLIVLANLRKVTASDREQARLTVRDLRSRVEVLKMYALLGWEAKCFSHGFFVGLSTKLEEISKQAAAWEKWLGGGV